MLDLQSMQKESAEEKKKNRISICLLCLSSQRMLSVELFQNLNTFAARS